jgi:hypothetical protein
MGKPIPSLTLPLKGREITNIPHPSTFKGRLRYVCEGFATFRGKTVARVLAVLASSPSKGEARRGMG